MPMKKKKGKPPNVSPARLNAEIRKAEDKAREEGLSLAMALMLTVLLDKFGAEDHIEDVWHEVEKLSEEVKEGRVNLNDLRNVLRKEYGIGI